MADLSENPNTFDTGIYQLETADPVVGGANGVSNAQAKALANRTAFLKAAIDAVVAGEGSNAPDNINTSLLWTALQAAIASAIAADGVPVGAILPCPANTPLPGTLALNGGMPLRAAYPDLWAYAQASNNVVAEAVWAATSWGAFSDGDLATTFRLPDYRGEFLRGLDGARGVDLGRILGDWQEQTFIANRAHSSNSLASATDIGIFSKSADGVTAAVPGANGNENYFMNALAAGGNAAAYAAGFGVRARNVAALFCIKF